MGQKVRKSGRQGAAGQALQRLNSFRKRPVMRPVARGESGASRPPVARGNQGHHARPRLVQPSVKRGPLSSNRSRFFVFDWLLC
jgi:hypothetical protein